MQVDATFAFNQSIQAYLGKGQFLKSNISIRTVPVILDNLCYIILSLYKALNKAFILFTEL